MKKTMLAAALCLVLLSTALCPAGAEALTPDLDLSVLSGTLAYAQVYNMMTDPESYLGKIIRMSGMYNFYEDAETQIVYHACIIPDATACCAQGIEFVWAGDHAWPADYPEFGQDITVTGRLEMYEENGYLYLHLVDAEVLFAQS